MSSVRRRPFPTSLPMACRVTFRRRAASAWLIQSEGSKGGRDLLVDVVNLFLLYLLLVGECYQCE